MIQVEELRFSRRDRKRFIEVEFRLNRHDPLWAPPLRLDRMKYMDPQRNPFFEHAEVAHFVAVRDGRDEGRIAAVRNRVHEETHGEAVGFFGFLETPDDAEVLEALTGAASAWLESKGLTSMRGPLSYDMNGISGALVEPFDEPPAILMPYNRAYLPRLLEAAGFTKAKDLLSYSIADSRVPERVRRLSDRLRRREGIEIRPFRRDRFDEELDLVRELYNRAWEKNWGFVPLTDAEMRYTAEDLRQVFNPDLVLFALVRGEPAGFSLALPDVNQVLLGIRSGRLLPTGILRLLFGMRRIDSARVITLGMLPEYRNRGIEILFFRETFDRGLRAGILRGECSWILEDNEPMKRGIAACGGVISKRYR
ncbi:MAG: N-acetyltransferase, partial [Planctomycetota bacterium]